MEDFLRQAAGTITLRPYYVAFFLVYALAGPFQLGLKRTFLFVPVGYLIAWTAEFSSIHNGIPFGHYYYTGLTMGRELWVLGVPFMDSMSFVFLSYASYSVALLSCFALSRMEGGPADMRVIGQSFKVRLLGALLCTYLDIVIDPVALQGDKWFLGKIHGYPGGGIYFGVPISNFIGWFLLGFVLIYALQCIDRLLPPEKPKNPFTKGRWLLYLPGPALYAGIMAFNLFVTFLIRDYALFWVGIMVALLPAVLLAPLVKTGLEIAGRQEGIGYRPEDAAPPTDRQGRENYADSHRG
jgi:putative membrane protein